jgi:hypothetical protein
MPLLFQFKLYSTVIRLFVFTGGKRRGLNYKYSRWLDFSILEQPLANDFSGTLTWDIPPP